MPHDENPSASAERSGQGDETRTGDPEAPEAPNDDDVTIPVAFGIRIDVEMLREIQDEVPAPPAITPEEAVERLEEISTDAAAADDEPPSGQPSGESGG